MMAFIAIVLWLSSASLSAQEIPESSPSSTSLSLDQAIDLAIQNYEKIKISKSNTDIAKGEEWQSYALALPTLEGSYQYTRNVKKPSIFFQVGKAEIGFDNEHQFEASLVQPLTRFGGIYQGVKSGRRAYQASVFANAQTHADVIFETRQAYYQTLFTAEALKIAQDSLDQSKEIRRREGLRFKVGEIPEFDYNRASLEEENKRAQLTQAEGNYQIAFETLRRIIDATPDQKIQLADSLEKFSRPIPEAEALQKFATTNPAIKALTKTAESREAGRKAARANFFPLFNFFTNYQAVGQSSVHFFPSSNEYFNALALGLNVDIPVFDGMLTIGKYKSAEAAAAKAAWQKTATEKDLRLDLEKAVIDAKVNLAKNQTDAKSVKLAETLYNQATLRFQNGILSYIDLKDVKNQLELARLRYFNSLYDYVLSLARMEQIVGSPLNYE